jgi:acyl dehydratase
MGFVGKISVGDRAPQRGFGPVRMTDIVRYQGASGDMNPIHHDPEFAQRAGFPTVFSVGMLQAGLLASFASDWLGYENLRSFGVRFRDKVWPGDRLVFDATVTAVDEKDGVRLVDLELTCAREGGGVALAGTAAFALREAAPTGQMRAANKDSSGSEPPSAWSTKRLRPTARRAP